MGEISERRHAPFGRPLSELRGFARENRSAMTEAEALLWSRLRKPAMALGVRVHRQKVLHGYIADFYVPKWHLIIEIDGEYHKDRIAYDRRRDGWLRSQGHQVARLTNAQIFADVDGTVRELCAAYGSRGER